MTADKQTGAETADQFTRSPELMNREDTAVLVVDMQERLLAAIPSREQLEWNVRRLLEGAAVLGLATAATEQYPEKLGRTSALLLAYLDPPSSKLAFSCAACTDLFAKWRNENRHRVLLCGIETHVCVQQTALDLLADGFVVYLAANAVASRFALDQEIALRRMEASGVSITTVEAALFEWCREAGTPQFKQISNLAKQSPPT